MASPRDLRRLSLLAMYQLEARPAEEHDLVRETLDETDALEEEGFSFVDPGADPSDSERDKAFAAAQRAFAARAIADEEIGALSTEWRIERMPAIDRAILRLAHAELTDPACKAPKAVVHEAVELAKQFSTEDSPSFVNAILDKVLKRVLERAPNPAQAES